jgi:dTMP kinase
MAGEQGVHGRVCEGTAVPGPGRLITIEGLDGAGKTTLAAGLADEFPRLLLLREPGGVALAERLRTVVKEPGLPMDPRAEALLYAAARAQLVAERLRPQLASGHDVLLDRFLDSSLAYQGAGRGLGVDAIRAVNLFGTGGLIPDLTLLLRIDPAAGRARLAARGEAPDRLESEPEDFFARVARPTTRSRRPSPTGSSSWTRTCRRTRSSRRPSRRSGGCSASPRWGRRDGRGFRVVYVEGHP